MMEDKNSEGYEKTMRIDAELLREKAKGECDLE